MSRPIHQHARQQVGSASGVLLLVLLFAGSVAGVAWVGMGIVAPDRWPIRWLEVNGDFQRVSAEQLRASLSPSLDSSFFTVDLNGLEAAAGRISWVASVDVQKIWPDTVTVTVDEDSLPSDAYVGTTTNELVISDIAADTPNGSRLPARTHRACIADHPRGSPRGMGAFLISCRSTGTSSIAAKPENQECPHFLSPSPRCRSNWASIRR